MDLSRRLELLCELLMTKYEINKEAIQQLYTWAYNPTSDVSLYDQVVYALSATDLHFLMTVSDEIVSRIAWLEWGRRRAHINFEVRLVRVEDCLELSYEGEVVPLTPSPVLKKVS